MFMVSAIFVVLFVNLFIWLWIFCEEPSYFKEYKTALFMFCGYCAIALPVVMFDLV